MYDHLHFFLRIKRILIASILLSIHVSLIKISMNVSLMRTILKGYVEMMQSVTTRLAASTAVVRMVTGPHQELQISPQQHLSNVKVSNHVGSIEDNRHSLSNVIDVLLMQSCT